MCSPPQKKLTEFLQGHHPCIHALTPTYLTETRKNVLTSLVILFLAPLGGTHCCCMWHWSHECNKYLLDQSVFDKLPKPLNDHFNQEGISFITILPDDNTPSLFIDAVTSYLFWVKPVINIFGDLAFFSTPLGGARCCCMCQWSHQPLFFACDSLSSTSVFVGSSKI